MDMLVCDRGGEQLIQRLTAIFATILEVLGISHNTSVLSNQH